MTRDEIHQAFRMIGRGFINHPLVEQLAESLADDSAPDEPPKAEPAQAEPKRRGRPPKKVE